VIPKSGVRSEKRYFRTAYSDHRQSPPPEALGLAGMTYQGLMRGVLVSYLKAKGYLPRSYRPAPQGALPRPKRGRR
jgi:hypothetical protein